MGYLRDRNGLRDFPSVKERNNLRDSNKMRASSLLGDNHRLETSHRPADNHSFPDNYRYEDSSRKEANLLSPRDRTQTFKSSSNSPHPSLLVRSRAMGGSFNDPVEIYSYNSSSGLHPDRTNNYSSLAPSTNTESKYHSDRSFSSSFLSANKSLDQMIVRKEHYC